jgi:hypothetical protein
VAWIIFGFGVLVILAMCFRLWRYGWPDDDCAREIVEEFARKFPGRCMICSMHRFGRNNGYEQKPEPEPHDCIERDPAHACVGLREPNPS